MADKDLTKRIEELEAQVQMLAAINAAISGVLSEATGVDSTAFLRGALDAVRLGLPTSPRPEASRRVIAQLELQLSQRRDGH